MARLYALAVLVLVAGPARAAATTKAITAVRATAPITVDGSLDEPIWRDAHWTDDFVDKEPSFGSAPAHPTRVAIAFDDGALYVAARMYADGPDDVDAALTRRDDGGQAERFIVSLDPARSHRTAYSFAITAGGVRMDWLHTDDDEHARDYSWDPVWDAAAAPARDGWIAEMRIPLDQLRYPGDAAAWGVNFNRYVPHRQEDTFWIAVPRAERAWSSRMGELRGLDSLAPPRTLEVIPYASLGLGVVERPDGVLDRRADPSANLGGDVRLGLGPDLSLAATLNPDFGQVEADPAIVNLTAYEVRLPERRPFFVEGAQIFRSAARSYFYSRRIGGVPAAVSLDVDDLRAPSSVRILGAARLTGRVAEDTNLGAIAAITDDAIAPVVEHGVRRDAAIAPRTAWGVARVEHALDDAGGLAGATLTTVARDLSDPTLAAQLATVAVTGGADLRLRPDHGAYELGVDVGGSALWGSVLAITRVQEASAHYFQRPDQPHVHLDRAARTMRGWAGDVYAARRAGAWLWESGFTAESPTFESNDAGTLMSADDLDGFSTLTRQDTEPGEHLHAWRVQAGADYGWNFGGVRKPGNLFVDSSFTLPSFATARAAITFHYPGLLDDLTRGGPLMRDGAGAWGTLSAASTPNRPTMIAAAATATWYQTGARGVDGSITLTSRPSQRLRLELTPRLLVRRIAQQYVDTIADGSNPDTYGARYLFASLWQREVATQLRAQLALTPDLALDAYLEPFVSVGRYSRLGELAAPRTSDVRTYADVARADGSLRVRDGAAAFALADPDFTAVSLRSTVVLRWEIQPGSVLYAVWQQTRGRTDASADPSYGVLGRPFAIAGEHVVAIKLSWWLGL